MAKEMATVVATAVAGMAPGELIRRAEGRLERLVESGWRNAAQEAAQLAEVAEAAAEVGMERLAERLRAVERARSAEEGLAAVAVALAACRLLRVRLTREAGTGDGEGEWVAVERSPARRGASKRGMLAPLGQPEHIIPVGRMAAGGGEAWACLRLRGQSASGWVLIDPCDLPGGAQTLRTAAGTEPAWLRLVLTGRLRWRARLPVGAEGSVERCALEEGAVAALEEDGKGHRPWAYWVSEQLRQGLKGWWKDGAGLVGGYGSLRLKKLHPDESAAYGWADQAAAEALRGGKGETWGVVWDGEGGTQPLALLSPRGLLKRAAVVHLVPGRPATPLE